MKDLEQEREDTLQRKAGAVGGVIASKGVKSSIVGPSPKK